VQLDIQDDGAGVPPEHQGKLFEPFFTTDAQGTGLGLFLARELAEANHAVLAYVPDAGGARFVLVCTGATNSWQTAHASCWWMTNPTCSI